MKRYFMFLGSKNQYCENDYITKNNPYQITDGISHRTKTKKKGIIHMEIQKTPNSQSNLEK